MKEPVELSKQQRKSKETKERIFQAANVFYKKAATKNFHKKYLRGSRRFQRKLYHHFKTKDDLLSYYIEDQPSIDPDRLELPKNKEDAKETIIHVYLNYVKYCKELAWNLWRDITLRTIRPLNPTIRTERPYPIVTVQHYLERALEANAIQLNLKIEEITTDIRMIVIGNVFEWAMRNGDADFEGNMRRSLSHYLDSIFVV